MAARSLHFRRRSAARSRSAPTVCLQAAPSAASSLSPRRACRLAPLPHGTAATPAAKASKSAVASSGASEERCVRRTLCQKKLEHIDRVQIADLIEILGGAIWSEAPMSMSCLVVRHSIVESNNNVDRLAHQAARGGESSRGPPLHRPGSTCPGRTSSTAGSAPGCVRPAERLIK